MVKFLPRFWAWIHADKERDLAEQVSKMESSEFLNFSFESDSSSDQPVDSAYVKHYKWLKGEEHVVIYLWLSLRAEFIFTCCIFVQGPTVTKVMTWSSSVDEKKGWNLKWINLQSFRSTFILSSIGFYLFGSQKFVNEFGHEWVWEQCFSIPSTVNAKNSNKFDCNKKFKQIWSWYMVKFLQQAGFECPIISECPHHSTCIDRMTKYHLYAPITSQNFEAKSQKELLRWFYKSHQWNTRIFILRLLELSLSTHANIIFFSSLF